MKKKDLRVGMICEDRSYYSQKHSGKPYVLILLIEKDGYYFIRGRKADNFYMSEPPLFGGVNMLRTSFHNVRNLKLIR